jgi:hypothetical protein
MDNKPRRESEVTHLPGESIHARLKRISQMPRRDGESTFVNGDGGIGPIVVIPVPSGIESTDVQNDEENEEHFRIYYERQRRFTRGIHSDPKVNDSSDPTMK